MKISSVSSISHKRKQAPEEQGSTLGSTLSIVLEGLMKGEDVPEHKAVVCSSGTCFLLFEIPQIKSLPIINEEC